MEGAKKMKKLGIAVVALAICLAGMVSSAMADDSISADVYLGMYNKYVFRGIDLSQNKWVSQFGADLSYKGFTLSYWSNLLTKGFQGNPDGFKAGDITETDITLNYTYTPECAPVVTFNAGNTFYSLEGLNDTNELYLKTTVNTLLSPTLSIYWDYDQAHYAGLYYTLGVSHSFELTKKLGLDLGALISYNQSNWSTSGNVDDNTWNDYELSTGLNYAITDKLSASASYTYSNALSHKARVVSTISDESLYGFKVAYTF
jgi:opacity protein-like surface antigen